MARIVEILIYTLKPETGLAFYEIMENISVPLHSKNDIDVMWHGQSLHSSDGYFLIRSFPDLATLQSAQNDFYGSVAWQTGPRDAIIDMIDQSLKVVVSMDEDAIEAIRENGYSVS